MAASVELETEGGSGDLSDIFKKYEKARKLNEEDSKNDPETEPYKSKYEAREILVEVKTLIRALYNDNENNEDLKYQVNGLECLLAANYIETEETSSGEEHLNKCLEALKSEKLNEKCVSIVLSALNQYGILWCARSDFHQALQYLQDSESLYLQYMHEVGKAPSSIHELFRSEDERLSEHDRQSKFEQLHTLTLYFLAQVHGKLDNKDKSAMYCHTTLQRQLETNQYDAVDWATNCATLSQYYLTNDDFTQARHCLASASEVFQEAYEKYLDSETPTEETEVDDPLPLRKADIARCWTKYCIGLLTLSKAADQSRILEDMERREDLLHKCEEERQGACGGSQDDQSRAPQTGEDSQAETPQTQEDNQAETPQTQEDNQAETPQTQEDNQAETPQTQEDNQAETPQTQEDSQAETPQNHKDSANGASKSELRFKSLELTAIETQVTDKLVKTYEEAREVFLCCQKWINESKEHYVLDGFVSDNINIIQDYSMLFKLLAFFETDLERKCRMHKRRVDMLQNILTDLNPQHFLMYCRQLQFEMADTYSEMVDLKILMTETQDRITPHAVVKINTLIGQCLKMYQMFVDSLITPDGQMPEKIEEDMLRPTLIANFCMGRLYSKFIEVDVDKKIEYIKKSAEKYSFVTEYCNKYPETIDIIRAEYELCTEMVSLLPLKLQHIRRTLP